MTADDRLSQQELLRAHGVKPTKKRGQNFLIDGNLARAVAGDVLALSSDVLELGAGGGALTRPLLDAGASVLAVEVDRGLCELLRSELGAEPRFTLHEGDIARLDWAALLAVAGASPVVAGNLPYVLTSEVLFALADHRERTSGGVFMVQREVAQRLVSGPGGKEYGVLSVLLGSLFEIELVRQVPSSVFWPRPDVKSAIVRLKPRADAWEQDEFLAFKDVIKSLFIHRRKQLSRILRTRLNDDADAALDVLSKAGIAPGDRPEQVDRGRLRELARRVTEWEQA
mgnify:CR=1 FL=1